MVSRPIRWIVVLCLISPLLVFAQDRIAFVSDRDGEAVLYTMRPDGSDVQRVVPMPPYGSRPSWSPDGSRLVFSLLAGGNKNHWDIYAVDANGSNLRQLTDHPASEYHPAWSPDGRFIAFDSNRSGNENLYLLRLDNGVTEQLTDDTTMDSGPKWSPDGNRILFQRMTFALGNAVQHVLDLRSRELTRLTDERRLATWSDWSPDGKRIVFQVPHDQWQIANGNLELGTNLYLMNADGTNRTVLTEELGSSNVIPSWAPDSRRVVFQSDRSGDYDIYVLDSETKQVLGNLTNHPADDSLAAWSNPFGLAVSPIEKRPFTWGWLKQLRKP